MKNKLFILLFAIFFICFISALDYNTNSGDTINITLDKPYDHYSIIGNSTEILLNITQVGNDLNITFDKYNKDDSFEIVFFDIKNEEIPIIQQNSNSGGGSSHTIKYVNRTVEVQNYVSIPNNTIEYLENKTTETKYVELNKPKWWMIGVGIILVGIIIGLLLFITKNTEFKEDIEESNSSEIKENKQMKGGEENGE